MEPRSLERGNFRLSAADEIDQLASMEPRSLERGNKVQAAAKKQSLWTLQWSHVHSNVETSLFTDTSRGTLRASMEPRSLERGNSMSDLYLEEVPLASMEPRSLERGNLQRTYDLAFHFRASMEPRSLERGNACR